MTDSGRNDPFADVISLVAGPIAAVIRSFEQLKRGSDELMKGFENFNATMTNLNETAARVNRLLNDFEEPIRAMLPQVTRTVKLADEMATRLSTPIDQVIPGLSRLADTLDSPVLRSMPTDLGQFMDVINDLAKRMSPLAQIAEQAGGLFGLRIPGFGGGSSTPKPAPTPPAATPPVAPAPAATPVKRSPARPKKAPARKTAPRRG
jgi:ABC-type transporter Mla subunit MlaD